MSKPTYEELEIQIVELKKQIEFILLNSDLYSHEKDKRSEELKRTKEKLEFEKDEKKKRAQELIIINQNLTRLLRLNADKDRFISILAHDLRGPFTGILGLLDLLVESIRENDIEYSVKLLNSVYTSAKNTFNLLEELIKWTQSQLSNLPFEPKEYNFKNICIDIIEFLQPIADIKNIKINQYIDDEIRVFADINMLKTILRNLISNAMKYTKAGGRINIDSEKTQSHLIITVTDNGIGMSPETLNQLFNISYIHSLSGTAAEKGSGLGLIICKELTEKHRGTISAEGQLGKGSKFNVSLPLKGN